MKEKKDQKSLLGASLPRILVVSVVPYNKSMQTRAFDSCFWSYPSEKLFQIFADPRVPCRGHCSTFYQIKDIDLLIHKINKKRKIGKLFFSDSLKDEWEQDDSIKRLSFKKRGILSYYLRKWIWKNGVWDTKELEKEVLAFKPEAIFLGFSYDFFLFEIAEHYQKLFNIPIFYYIADDFPYNYDKKTPLYSHYHRNFLKYVKGLMSKDGYGIFNSDKIRKHFKDEYGLDGSVVYIPSEIRPTQSSGSKKLTNLYYFGNLSLGRDKSILTFARISKYKYPDLKIYVYAPDIERFDGKKLPSCLTLHKGIPYSKVIEIIKNKADGLLVAEGFKKGNIRSTEFALSTKVGDYVCSGKPIIAFGPSSSGTIDFFRATDSGLSVNDEETLKIVLTEFNANNFKRLETSRENQFNVATTFFNKGEQSSKFRKDLMSYLGKRRH